ncbi:MAG: DUF86 domain-containing protein [Bacteroidia bacterium]|nr:DUF86 domain-containing protein [Bacteroidia bacterium]
MKKSQSPLERIRHIQDECQFLVTHTNSKALVDLESDPVLSRAVIRSLEIIGEAVKNLPDEIKNKYPAIEWKSISRMRDRLIHHYDGVDMVIVNDAIHTEIPQLYKAIQELLQS